MGLSALQQCVIFRCNDFSSVFLSCSIIKTFQNAYVQCIIDKIFLLFFAKNRYYMIGIVSKTEGLYVVETMFCVFEVVYKVCSVYCTISQSDKSSGNKGDYDIKFKLT